MPRNKYYFSTDFERGCKHRASELELAELYGSGHNPENNIVMFFDPSRVFQRARACRNIRFGSKNRKTKSSSCLTRAVYFSELELA